jgi:CheY-like chemotaxis protein
MNIKNMPTPVARVLLVEDDEDDYILTSEYLNQLDSHTFEIDWVTNPTKALEQLNLGKHDICLLDYQLGAYNGLTVLEKASKAHAGQAKTLRSIKVRGGGMAVQGMNFKGVY